MPLSEKAQRRHDEYQEIKVRLLEKHGLTDHPKADKLFEMAWEHGHSAGEHEVDYWVQDLAELVK